MMLYAFRIQESSAVETDAKLRRMLGKAITSSELSRKAANITRLVKACVLQGFSVVGSAFFGFANISSTSAICLRLAPHAWPQPKHRAVTFRVSRWSWLRFAPHPTRHLGLDRAR